MCELERGRESQKAKPGGVCYWIGTRFITNACEGLVGMDEATIQAERGQAQWQSQARGQAGLSGTKEEIDTTNLHIDSTLSFLRAGQKSQDSADRKSVV